MPTVKNADFVAKTPGSQFSWAVTCRPNDTKDADKARR